MVSVSQRPSGTRGTKTLLLTILGSAVVPRGFALWQETYVRLLMTVGAGSAAARQALARAVSDQWLTRERVGRRSRMSPTAETRSRLVEAYGRTMVFGGPRQWNGEWLLAALSVPEKQRALRHQFKTQLAWLGFGSLGNGLWVSPHTENESVAAEVLSDADEAGDAYLFTSARPSNRSPEEVAAAAWDLGQLRDRYDDFCRRFEAAAPVGAAEVFQAWVELTTTWRHFPLFDPELPDRLLPTDWPRRRAYELFQARHREWVHQVHDYIAGLDAEARP